MSHTDHGGRAAAPISAPVRLSVRCDGCDYARTTLALHDGAVVQALRCPRCRGPAEVVEAVPMVGTACSCCL